jgi:hypothetical protein
MASFGFPATGWLRTPWVASMWPWSTMASCMLFYLVDWKSIFFSLNSKSDNLHLELSKSFKLPYYISWIEVVLKAVLSFLSWKSINTYTWQSFYHIKCL